MQCTLFQQQQSEKTKKISKKHDERSKDEESREKMDHTSSLDMSCSSVNSTENSSRDDISFARTSPVLNKRVHIMYPKPTPERIVNTGAARTSSRSTTVKSKNNPKTPQRIVNTSANPTPSPSSTVKSKNNPKTPQRIVNPSAARTPSPSSTVKSNNNHLTPQRIVQASAPPTPSPNITVQSDRNSVTPQRIVQASAPPTPSPKITVQSDRNSVTPQRMVHTNEALTASPSSTVERRSTISRSGSFDNSPIVFSNILEKVTPQKRSADKRKSLNTRPKTKKVILELRAGV